MMFNDLREFIDCMRVRGDLQEIGGPIGIWRSARSLTCLRYSQSGRPVYFLIRSRTIRRAIEF